MMQKKIGHFRQAATLFLITLLVISGLIVPTQGAVAEQIGEANQTITVTLRVEGSATTIYPQTEVEVATNSSVLDVLQQALDAASVYYDVDQSSPFAYITQIENDVQSQFGVWDGWQYMVNGVKPWDAVNDYYVQDQDQIYLYYGNIGELYLGSNAANEVGKLTLLPEIEVIPNDPVSNQSLQIKVTAKYDIYDEDFDLVASGVEAIISGASVFFNGQYYVTDQNGLVTVPAASVLPGSYEIRVTKDVLDSYPRLVRSEKAVTISVGVSSFEVVDLYR